MTAAEKFWIATVANFLVAGLLALVFYAMMLALAVIAPEISSWPLFKVKTSPNTFGITPALVVERRNPGEALAFAD